MQDLSRSWLFSKKLKDVKANFKIADKSHAQGLKIEKQKITDCRNQIDFLTKQIAVMKKVKIMKEYKYNQNINLFTE